MEKHTEYADQKTNIFKMYILPQKEFRILIVKVIQDLGKRMEAKIKKMQQMFNKDLEELKNKQTEMKNTITKMKKTLEGINSRITEAECEEK